MEGLLAAQKRERAAVSRTKELAAKEKTASVDQPGRRFSKQLMQSQQQVRKAREETKSLLASWSKSASLVDVPELAYDRSCIGLGVDWKNKRIKASHVLALGAGGDAKEALLALKVKNPHGWKATGNKTKVKQYFKRRGVWNELVSCHGSEEELMKFLGFKK